MYQERDRGSLDMKLLIDENALVIYFVENMHMFIDNFATFFRFSGLTASLLKISFWHKTTAYSQPCM